MGHFEGERAGTTAVRRRRRHFADAADRMSASRRRRFRDVFTSCVHQLYVATFLYSNAVYNEASTLTESRKKRRGRVLQ